MIVQKNKLGGGQFAPAGGGQYKSAEHGQFGRCIHFRQVFEDFLKPIRKLIQLTDPLISDSEKISNYPLNNKSLWVIGLARSRISDIKSLLKIGTFSDVHVRSMTFTDVRPFLVLFSDV